MKTSNLVVRIAMAALFLCVLVYFGFYIYGSFKAGLTTVRAYADTVNVGLEANGLVVREEQVITLNGSGAAVDLAPSEGEKVAGGDVVATLYSSSYGLETKKSIQTLEAEIEQLQYALRSSAGASDSARVESDLLETIAGFRASAAAGNLTRLESDALQLRTLVFKRDYAYGDASATQELQDLIAYKTAQLEDLRSSLGAVSTVIYAARPGVFSGMADGFEELVRPGDLDQITPARLNSLRAMEPAAPAGAVGRLITSTTWYFASTAPAAEAAALRTGQRYTVVFSRDYSGEIPMKLERISDEENGTAALVFSCRTNLSDITLLRSQTVDIVTDQITGIRVPRSTLRALEQTVKRTVTNEATGEKETIEEQITVTGVYTVVSQQAEFVPVNVLYQGEDFFLVEPADPDAADRLRAGDEIIVSTAGIFDGKVVR